MHNPARIRLTRPAIVNARVHGGSGEASRVALDEDFFSAGLAEA